MTALAHSESPRRDNAPGSNKERLQKQPPFLRNPRDPTDLRSCHSHHNCRLRLAGRKSRRPTPQPHVTSKPTEETKIYSALGRSHTRITIPYPLRTPHEKEAVRFAIASTFKLS